MPSSSYLNQPHVCFYSCHVAKYERTSSRLLVVASGLSFVFYSLILRQWFCWIKERGCHYVTTHNSTDRCRAKHEASLVTQIIRLTYRWVAHSKRRPTLEAVSTIMLGHVIAPSFPLSNRATDVRPGCKTQRIAPTLRQVADLMCARVDLRYGCIV
ncbi:hypothetical protein PoB_000809000 [Plakobranchus ocellatus]|uniref:Uncharacterized protein n=1 Tax=Plakobranchus ocellatus TaxID=259542 RepID=A0AAV3YFQ6_9GAST|nr:hypothetical protein PoB_000809000 [Plakobranchus ocellatus]